MDAETAAELAADIAEAAALPAGYAPEAAAKAVREAPSPTSPGRPRWKRPETNWSSPGSEAQIEAEQAASPADKGTLFAHFKRLFQPAEEESASSSSGLAKVKSEPEKEETKKLKKPKDEAKLKTEGKAKAKAKGKAKAKAKPKAKSKAKAQLGTKPRLKAVKKEKVVRRQLAMKVKKEPGTEVKHFSREHYRHQTAFIEQIVAGEWKVCFGALGTGIVGVTPKEARPSQDDPDPEKGEASLVEASQPSSSSASKQLLKVEKPLPKDSAIILFKNAPNCNLQSRNGKALGGYASGLLDAEKRTLEWTSQRRDVNNKVILALVDYIGKGGRLLVAVRPPQSGEPDGDYRLLGQVARIDGLRLADLLVEKGELVLQEKGSSTTHKSLNANCLHDGLRKGVGLQAVPYVLDGSKKFRFCISCCYRTPSCVLHFDSLEPAGVTAYKSPPKGAKNKSEPEAPAPVFRPTKRFRVKKAPQEDDAAPGGSQDSVPAAEAGQEKRQELLKVKSEPGI